MRIIAGSRKGHKLHEFSGRDIRPTTDRVKESVFNLIQEFIPGSRTLDLFGGSGALTFEALSRGAESGICVDISGEAVSVIKKNQEELKFDNFAVINTDAAQFLKSTDKTFSVIFLDPPYNKGFIAPVINQIVDGGRLERGGIIVLESDFCDEHGEFSGLSVLKQRKYGRTYITVYQRG